MVNRPTTSQLCCHNRSECTNISYAHVQVLISYIFVQFQLIGLKFVTVLFKTSGGEGARTG